MPKLGSRISVSKNSPPTALFEVATQWGPWRLFLMHQNTMLCIVKKPQEKTNAGVDGTCPLFFLASSSEHYLWLYSLGIKGQILQFTADIARLSFATSSITRPKRLKGRSQDKSSQWDWRAIGTDPSYAIPLHQPISSRLMIFAPTNKSIQILTISYSDWVLLSCHVLC